MFSYIQYIYTRISSLVHVLCVFHHLVPSRSISLSIVCVFFDLWVFPPPPFLFLQLHSYILYSMFLLFFFPSVLEPKANTISAKRSCFDLLFFKDQDKIIIVVLVGIKNHCRYCYHLNHKIMHPYQHHPYSLRVENHQMVLMSSSLSSESYYCHHYYY